MNVSFPTISSGTFAHFVRMVTTKSFPCKGTFPVCMSKSLMGPFIGDLQMSCSPAIFRMLMIKSHGPFMNQLFLWWFTSAVLMYIIVWCCP